MAPGLGDLPVTMLCGVGLTWKQETGAPGQLLKVVLEPPCWLPSEAFCRLWG